MTQHMEKCNGEIEGPSILCTANTKSSKNRMKYDLRVKEALFIRRYDCGPFKGMNEDNGSYVKTTQWDPVFAGMKGLFGGEPGSREILPLTCDHCMFAFSLPTLLFLIFHFFCPSFSPLIPTNELWHVYCC